mmetsp:Transcript_12217/g.45470  ORF Transcript_12217/g.45470 Transcript_12217/m.45470 type:complete len:260 (+) Transcript_12217:5484-6263(+)
MASKQYAAKPTPAPAAPVISVCIGGDGSVKDPFGFCWDARNAAAVVRIVSSGEKSNSATASALANVRNTNAVSQTLPGFVPPSYSRSPNAENAPLSWRYVSWRWYPTLTFLDAFSEISRVAFCEIERYFIAAALGASVIMFCSPHPKGICTSFSRPDNDGPITSPINVSVAMTDPGTIRDASGRSASRETIDAFSPSVRRTTAFTVLTFGNPSGTIFRVFTTASLTVFVVPKMPTSMSPNFLGRIEKFVDPEDLAGTVT